MTKNQIPPADTRGRITAQLAAAILGSNQNMSREDAMRRMVRDWHGAPSEGAANLATEYAKNNIPGALMEYTMETGGAVEQDPQSNRDEWAVAGVTGLVSIFGAVLVVCPFNLRDAVKPVQFKGPEDQERHIDRIQFFLWVTGRAWCDLYQWCPAATRLDRIMPDAAWRRKYIPKLRAFWDEFQEERQQDNAVKHLEPKRKLVEGDDARRIVDEYDQICEAIDNATARKAELIADMVRLSGGKDALIAGRTLTLVKRAGSVSYAKAIKELAPTADLEKWRGKPSESWLVK